MENLDRAIIGFLFSDLLDDTEKINILRDVKLEYFSTDALREIFEGCRKQRLKGKPINKDIMGFDSGQISEISGCIGEFGHQGSQFSLYLEQLKKEYKRKLLERIPGQISRKIDAGIEPDKILSDFELELEQIREVAGDSGQDLIAGDFSLLLDEKSERLGFMPGKEILDLSKSYHGIWGLTVLLGPPESGKSLLALHLARDVIQHKVAVLYYALEMNYRALLKRLLAIETDEVMPVIWDNTKQIIEENEKKLLKYRELLTVSNSCDIGTIKAQIERCREAGDSKQILVIIDYLQLIPSPQKTLKEHVDFLLNEIRLMHNDLSIDGKIAFLLISQTTREATKETADYWDKEGKLISHLFTGGMGSAGIESSADFALGMVRHPQRNESKVVFLKHREGPKPPPQSLIFEDRGLKFKGNKSI